jgi:hypothetical protein
MASSAVPSSPSVARGETPPGTPAAVGKGTPWWLQPVLIVVVLSGFGLYATWAAFQGRYYEVGPYLSPFYSPEIWRTGPISPAVWILWIPLLFRATCYYYRKSYYRSFFWDPPACAISEPRRGRYRGETVFPWVFSNLHRFFLYLSIVVVAVLWYDALKAFFYNGRLYFGLGTLILLVNVVLLSLYTLSCHSLRHLLGGNVDCYSCVAGGNTRHSVWGRLSQLNKRHGLYAWLSLFSVLIADVYVRFFAAAVENLPVVH